MATPLKTFEQGRDEIRRLCDYFSTNQAAFLGVGVKEAHVRQSLIDPLFEALGWDVRNTGHIAPQYREVVPEDSLEVEGQAKAPDYTFRVGALPRFYAEAKKCGVDLGGDPGPAYQLRSYGWSAKLPLCILTDFEELAVYDCTSRPRPSDKASRARILYLRWEEYADRWREVWDIFSREAVWSGAFDQFAASKRAKRGTSEVDAEFLKEIEGWRDELARHLALRNPGLACDDLNRAVQLTIDRIVFLRMAEDRGLEPYEQLLRLSEGPDVYRRFVNDLCRKADGKYNSGLFHFRPEPGVAEGPDRITPSLALDDKVFGPILQGLYFAHGSPYQFSVLPVEILGTVYERFLGKVIRLTPGHHAKVEEKPEVRKAGGVYYTPKYIVDYIVREAVGKAIEGRSPVQLTRGPFRVLDMACGSGSFLLGAYQALLHHALAWYSAHRPERRKRAIRQDPRTGEWRLTIAEKKRILTAHLFGVDVDPQAVEVTKLSLLLKVLERESAESVGQTMQLFQARALPNLAENIRCGNSLIGHEYLSSQLLPDVAELQRINPFDWGREFPAAMRSGGFDCIVGNPPYIRIQTMREWAPREVEIYNQVFKSTKSGSYDKYTVFVERALQLLRTQGRVGFIVPHKFFNARYGESLRAMIAAGRHLSHVVHFGHAQVFKGATTYTCLLFLDEAGAEKCRFVQVSDLDRWRAAVENGGSAPGSQGAFAEAAVRSSHVTSAEWNFQVGDGARLFARLQRMPLKLGDACDIFVGVQTSADDVFLMDLAEEAARSYRLRSKALGRDWTFERDLLFPIVSGTDVRSYFPLPRRQFVLFPYSVSGERARLLDLGCIQRDCPRTAAYLIENKDRLEEREHGRFRGPGWYRFGRSQNLGIQGRAKLCVPRLVETLHAGYDAGGDYFLDNVDVGGVTLKEPHQHVGLLYILALLNSRLLRWFFPRVSAPFRGGWRSANRQFLSLLPMRVTDLSDSDDRLTHERVTSSAETMVALHRRLAQAQSGAERQVIERAIQATDETINRLVYQLYGLTDSEIAIVEAGARETR